MKYNVSLDSKELFKLSSDLLKYADDFENKVHTFLDKLSRVGFMVAVRNGGDFSHYITYSKRFDDNTTVVITAHSSPITAKWYARSSTKTVRTEEISPLLMAEFGSGHYAIQGTGEAAGLGGQGTLNKYGHAFDIDGWYWWSDDSTSIGGGEIVKDANGRFKFHSMGTRPSRPLHKAVMACVLQVEEIAREVFG